MDLSLRIRIFVIATLVFIVLDWYGIQAVKTAFASYPDVLRKWILPIWYGLSLLPYLVLLSFLVINPEDMPSPIRNFSLTFLFTALLTKLFLVLFLFGEDIYRGIVFLFMKFFNSGEVYDASRSAFLSKVALGVASIPTVGVLYGILNGAHDYKVHRVKLALKGLPKNFEGFKIVQLSDIHAGSFFSKTAVERGVQMVNNLKADAVFFTGDLVNNVSGEMDDWKEVFSKIQAPRGVYSVLGNHDYGDYVGWDSPQAKQDNLKRLIGIHKEMGWDILINEHRLLEKEGEHIAIVGIENWGAKGHFPKYGDMPKAMKGTEQVAVRLLLSHDPSHWEAQVLKEYPGISAMFAGHTHGMQFGVERDNGFKWSPVQYMYTQWAGLYQQGEQYLYVNRGFGYIGYPGRVGISPEITLIELTQA
jgi:predicted MPP superfamily phosphohydrolase